MTGRRTEALARVAALGAVLLAAALVGAMMLGGGPGSYEVKVRFLNAGQVVKGGLVQSGGVRIGEIRRLSLTSDGLAELTLAIDDDHAPLAEGTRATIRRVGLSGPASRYVHLEAPRGAARGEVPDGGTLGTDSTTSLVDLDQFFGIFEPRTRAALRGVIRGSERQYNDTEGGAHGADASSGLRYLDPALVASTRLFEEVNRHTPDLERFVTESSRLVGDLAARRENLAGLVDHLADTTQAISRPRGALGRAIAELPPFMRRANTTYVNLRGALDDLDALVRDARPAAPKLRPYLAELRGVAEELRPTLTDLSSLIRRPGADNDLIDTGRSTLPLRDVAVRSAERNGERRPGGLPTAAEAFDSARPRFAFFRPYMVDVTGWFDDYSHSGLYDGLGGFARVATTANAFSLRAGVLNPISPETRAEHLRENAATGRNNYCPGAMERDPGDGSTPFRPSEDFNCDPTMIPVGP